MPKRTKGVWLVLMSVFVATAAAQDEPIVENPYALKKKMAALKTKVDPALVRALGDKVAECYEREQNVAMSKEDRDLLREYGSDVARDLGAAFSTTGCAADQRATPACLKLLEGLECETLAAPIIAAGWDRNLTPEARAQVVDYAGMLSRREARCEGRAEEEADIVKGIRGDRLSLLIESQIVIGQCELHADKLPDCETELQNATCERMAALNDQGKLQQICSSVLHCVEAPPPEGPHK